MSNYCFTTNQRALFAEVGIRGWHAAILDFPQQKSEEEVKKVALRIPDELRNEVCCIPENDYLYGVLVVNAWAAFYMTTLAVVGERLMAHLILQVKPMPASDGRDFLRRVLDDPGMQEVLDDLYARYQAGIAQIGQ